MTHLPRIQRFAFLALLPLCVRHVSSCTTIAAGSRATRDGSVLVAHSNDGAGDVAGDFGIVLARNFTRLSYRVVSNGRIPQPAMTTNAYFSKVGGYAAMNEHQVALGESTCVAVFPGDKSKAKLNIVDLSAIGLERADTARAAIEVMGGLAETYGYYDSGESLMVIDATEAWIFHVLPDDTGSGAVWAAQRVPDDHVAVVANAFTIREIDFYSSTFLTSANIKDVAVRTKRWPGEAKGVGFDFTWIFAGAEMAHRYASGHRMWTAFRRLANAQPFAKLPLYYHEYVSDAPYPATLPAQNVTLTSMKGTMRDYYEGTALDMTKGTAAGAFGSPDRWMVSGEDVEAFPHVSWERPIATSRTIVSYVGVARSWLPDHVGAVLWLSFHAAHTAVALPLPVGLAAKNATLPRGFTGNSLSQMRRGVSAFQASRMVFTAAQSRFDLAIQDVRSAQKEWEEEGKGGETVAGITDGTRALESAVAHCEAAVERWWALSDEILLKYADGFCNGCGSRVAGYPVDWLEASGYARGPLTPALPVPPPPMGGLQEANIQLT